MVLVEDVTDSAGRSSSGTNTSSSSPQSTQSEVMVMNFLVKMFEKIWSDLNIKNLNFKVTEIFFLNSKYRNT